MNLFEGNDSSTLDQTSISFQFYAHIYFVIYFLIFRSFKFFGNVCFYVWL